MKYEWPPYHIAINLTTQNLQLLHSEEEAGYMVTEMESNEYNQRSILRNENFVSGKRIWTGYRQFTNPLGRHYIRAKIGEGYKENSVFVARRFTGEFFDPHF